VSDSVQPSDGDPTAGESSGAPQPRPSRDATDPAGHYGQHSQHGEPGTAGQPDAPGSTRLRRRTRLLFLVAVSAFLLDLVTKVVVVAALAGQPPLRLLGGLVYFTEARNSGAAFSFAQGATVLFTAIAATVVVVILRTARNLRSAPWAWSLGLVLGGAAGNLVDRVFRSPGPLRGAVVDFISVFDPYGRAFPIFNVADSAIVCGGILAVLLAVTGREFDGTRHTRAANP
jgi:signal peptidase II